MVAGTSGRAAATAAACLVLAAAGALATPHAASAKAKPCGRVSFTQGGGRTYAYSVRRDKGSTTCARARAVLRSFLVTAVSPRGWFCVRGHASQHQAWAATCASGAGTTIRAFGPLKI